MGKIVWNIASGFYSFQRINYFLSEYNLPYKFEVFDSNPTKWAGGRILSRPVSNWKAILRFYQRAGIPFYFTFSAHEITKWDLDDPFGNEMLSYSKKGDGVIITNPRLEAYIRSNYSHLKVCYSVINSWLDDVANLPDRRVIRYYNRACEQYDKVVILPEFNRNKNILQNLCRDKIEILVNETCNYKCKVKVPHYYALMQESKFRIDNPDKPLPRELFFPCPKSGKAFELFLDNHEIDQMLDIGFKYFKIQGRTDPSSDFVLYLNNYLRVNTHNRKKFGFLHKRKVNKINNISG